MIEPGDTRTYIKHVTAADFAALKQHQGYEEICSFTARVGDRLVAEGKTGQKILKKEKLARVLAPIKS